MTARFGLFSCEGSRLLYSSSLGIRASNLFLFLFSSCFLITFRCFRITRFLTRALTVPLWKSCLWPLCPLVELFFPESLQQFCPHNLTASLIELLPVPVGPGVSPAFILGEHSYLGRMSSCEGFWVKTLLHRLVPQLDLLPLMQLFELIILVHVSLLIVILVCLKAYDGVPDLICFVPQLVGVHGVQLQRLNTNTEGNLHLLLDLLLGF